MGKKRNQSWKNVLTVLAWFYNFQLKQPFIQQTKNMVFQTV